MEIIEIEYFIGGGGDKNDFIARGITGSTNVVLSAKKYRDNTFIGVKTLYFGHEDEDEIVDDIVTRVSNHNNIKVHLTGHSWGGGAAINIAHRLTEKNMFINELITLDPVALLPKAKVTNASIWVNIYQDQNVMDYIATVPLIGNIPAGILSAIAAPFSSSHDIDDAIATIGGQLGHQQGALNKATSLHHREAEAMYKIARTAIFAQKSLLP